MTTATRTLLLSATLLLPGIAFAEDLRINLTDYRGRAIDGQVTATPSGGGTAVRCTTRGGSCTLHVSAGTYSVRATTLTGGTIPTKSVTISAGRTATSTLQQTAPGTGTTGSGSTGTVGGTTTGTTSTGTGTSSTGSLGSSGGGTTSSTNRGVSTPTSEPRNLGTGNVASIRGNAQDNRGRPIDGTITVKQGTTTIGTCRTSGGSFVAHDLAAGAYTLTLRTSTGATGSANVTVRAGTAVTVTVRLQ